MRQKRPDRALRLANQAANASELRFTGKTIEWYFQQSPTTFPARQLDFTIAKGGMCGIAVACKCYRRKVR